MPWIISSKAVHYQVDGHKFKSLAPPKARSKRLQVVVQKITLYVLNNWALILIDITYWSFCNNYIKP